MECSDNYFDIQQNFDVSKTVSLIKDWRSLLQVNYNCYMTLGIKDDKTDGKCSTHEGDEKCILLWR
jgi:hypothetical protein